MANTGKAIGLRYNICRDSGSFGSPAHIPIIGAKDIKVTAKPSAVVDGSDRVSTALLYEKVIPIRHNIEWSFNALYNGGAGLLALKNALIAGTAIRLTLMNNPPADTTTGAGVGYRGDWLIKKGSFKWNLREGNQVDFVGCPHGGYTNAVVSYTDATTVLGVAETQATKKLGTNASVNDSSNAPITAVQDISLDFEWDVTDATDRAAASPDDYDMYLPTRLKINAGVSFIWKEDDTQLVAFRTAWKANSSIMLSIQDGTYAAGWGVGAAGGVSWSITDYPLDANLIEGQKYSVKLQPSGNYTVAPAYVN
jgi:hypothetical protein